MLKKYWQDFWRKLQVPKIPIDILDQLISAYSSPDRFYHNLTHITDCLSLFEQTKFLATHPEEVELAIWFHDAVYDTTRSDNEHKSAQWAQSVIIESGLSHDIAQRVFQLIEATAHHSLVNDRDARVLVDIDLSILGREDQIFWQYEHNIRKEYAWVSEDLFRSKRIEILNNFLNRSQIYSIKEYRQKFEEKARINIEQAIAKLKVNSEI